MTPTRRRLSRALLAALALTRGLQLVACARPDDPTDAASRTAYLTARLADPAAGWAPNEFYQGEWRIVALSMTALALLDQGAAPDAFATLAAQATTAQARAFDTAEYHADALATLESGAGHAGYLGHAGVVLAAQCLAGHPSELGARVAQALRRRLLAAPDGLVETYPGRKWVPDNGPVLAAVELDARCRGLPSIAHVADRWPRDAAGLLRFTPATDARGSGAGFLGLYLASVDRSLVRAQWALAKARFGVAPLPGFFALREYPHGEGGHRGDADSGPLVFGLSPSGTGFGIAAARAAGDAEAASGLARVAELVGVTVPTGGGRHFAFGPLVGDAAVTAGLSLKDAGPRLALAP